MYSMEQFKDSKGDKPVGHSISDVRVHGVALWSGTIIQRKQREMRLIFQVDIVQLKGLNTNVSFIWPGTLYTS